MIKKLLTPIVFLLLFSIKSYSQEIDSKKYIKNIHKAYVEQLDLTNSQSKKFKAILEKFNPIIKRIVQQKVDKNKFNAQIKLMDLEVYQLLNQDQFAKYKLIKVELESIKEYRY